MRLIQQSQNLAINGDFSSLLAGTIANLCASSGAAAPANLNYDTGHVAFIKMIGWLGTAAPASAAWST
jgi:hypothetical protein